MTRDTYRKLEIRSIGLIAKEHNQTDSASDVISNLSLCFIMNDKDSAEVVVWIDSKTSLKEFTNKSDECQKHSSE